MFGNESLTRIFRSARRASRRRAKLFCLLGGALLILLLVSMGWTQGNEWKWLTGNNLQGVKFLKGTNEGWAVGQQGLILHTTDGGDHWEVQNSNTQQDLFGLFFLDQNNGWVTGGYKTCLRTRDGGRNWQVIHTEPSGFSHFKGVCFLDTMVGWVVGPYDSILKSTDGGATWNGIDRGIMQYYLSITFPEDSLHGWTASPSHMTKTTDGGISWRDTVITGIGGGNCIDFSDTLHGWSVGPGWTARTTDGGKTWVSSNPTSALLNGVSFFDTIRGKAVGGDNTNLATILRTTDGGVSWVSQTQTNNSAFYGVSAPESAKAYVVGQSGSILKTTNGGIGWQILRNTDINSSDLLNVFFYDSNQGWGTGTNGVITHTTNGGTVWTRQGSGTGNYVFGVDFPDPLRGWVSSDWGEIITTTDAGNTWTFQNSNLLTFPLFSLDFVDTLYGVVVGGDYRTPEPPKFRNRDKGLGGRGQREWGAGVLGRQGAGEDSTLRPWGTGYGFWKYPWRPEETIPLTPYRAITRTTNGGALWIAKCDTGQVPLYGVSFVSRTEGWACGDPQGGMGVILHTTDSGATWQGQSSNVSRGLYWIQFRGRQTGWCVGDAGTALWTTDGGNTWNQGNSGTTQQLLSCGFYGAQNGFACGANGLLLKTTDGGRNWQADTSKVHATLSAIYALDSLHAWTAGSTGIVLGWREAGMSGVEARPVGSRQLAISRIKATPNPFVSYARVLGHEKERFTLYDITGRRMGTYPGEKIGADVASGIYFLMAVDKEAGHRTEGRPVRIVKVR